MADSFPEGGDPGAPGADPPLSPFNDGRGRGAYETVYPGRIWVQIILELIFLYIVAAVAGLELLRAATNKAQPALASKLLAPLAVIGLEGEAQVRLWSVVFYSGVLGGTVFALKWLYHGVAWREWHRDRVIWRVTVPFIGGLLGVFTGAMIMAGIVPLLSKDAFRRLLYASGYGFFVGLFADNFLAALQRLATRLLGTLGRSN